MFWPTFTATIAACVQLMVDVWPHISVAFAGTTACTTRIADTSNRRDILMARFSLSDAGRGPSPGLRIFPAAVRQEPHVRPLKNGAGVVSRQISCERRTMRQRVLKVLGAA